MAVLKYGVTGEMLFVAQNYVYKIDQLFNYMHSYSHSKMSLMPLMVEESNSIVKIGRYIICAALISVFKMRLPI